MAGPRRDAVGPVHHRAAPRPGRRARGAGRSSREHARLSYAKVAEYQRRGLVHFHAVIRLDGPDGPTDPPPAGLDLAALRAAITTAARAANPDHTSARRDTAAARLGPATGPPGGHRRRTAADRGRARGDHRRRPGRIHRQVRHQRHRRHRRRRPPDQGRGARRAPADQRPPPTHDHHRVGAGRPARLRRAQPAPVGAHARLPRPLPHQEPPVLGDLHSTARASDGPGGCSPTSPNSTPRPTTPTRSRPTSTPSP